MYLKALEINGFKSFSTKTVIDFTQGITSIVGPNGSGKSNILDAILWVLGEQSYKNIRASMSSDVIFSGGKNKKHANSAEVSLLIDNEDRYLDYEADDVKITRRIYRNGEGEYLINNKKSRLKDIHNLFMDTGIGKQAYSIIGQGRVERIIGSNPKEIREILEEAAGTKRAKLEKDDALKKLSNVQVELEKITYVERELEQRVKRLKEESEKAGLYNSLVHQINVNKYMLYEFNINKIEVEQNLLILEKEANSKKIENIQENLEKENEKLKETSIKKNEMIHLIEVEKNKLTLIFNELDVLKEELNSILLEKSNYEVKLAEKLLIKDKLLSDEKIYDDKIKVENKEINHLNKDYIKKKDSIDNLKEKIEYLTKLRNEIEEKLSIHEKTINEIEMKRYRLRGENEDLDRKNKLTENNKIKLEEEKNNILLNLKKVKLEFDALKNRESNHEKSNKSIIDKQKKYTEEISILDKERKILNNESQKIIFEKESKLSKFESIQKTLDDNVFLNASSKFILDNFKDDNNVINTVSNLLDIPEKYLTAISVLVGFSLNDIVIKRASESKKYITELKNKKIGTISFLPLDNIKTFSKITKLPEGDGVIDFARNVVKIKNSEYDKVLDFIFSNALIVEDIDIANKLIKNGFSDRVITLDGDLVTARGRISGGYKKNKVDLTLSKKDELRTIKRDMELLDKKKKEIDDKYKNILEKIEDFEEKLSNENEKVNKYKLEYNDIKYLIDMKNNEISSLERKIDTIDYEIKDSNLIIIENTNKIDKNIQEIDQSINIIEEIYSERESLEFKLGEIEDVDRHQTKLHNMLVEFAVINEKLNNKNKTKDELKLMYNKIRKDLNEIDIFEHNKDELFSNFNVNILEKNVRIENITKDRDILNESIKNNEVMLKSIEKNEVDHFNKISELEKETIKMINIVEKLSENIGRNSNELENLNEKMEELHESKESIVNDFNYNKLEEDRVSQVKSNITRLENKKENIGSVNLASIDEYNFENERYMVLVNQKQDLENSSNSIKNLISNIENDMITKFTYALNEIKNNFKYMCNEIFYGAKADIKLTDPDNILNTGLELSVKYKNKPEQTLMLLSGGEKSMLAVSFIMAIFMFKPSPFTFFDEIEAALDEANTKKIIELLRRFIDKSQFILITHNKETMKGSDRLYGVTMNKEIGESKIVSVDI
ncbi:chromosome segregation protein SMC [Streptobacillus felis]|uniref:Chromosome partition protein Smc n=2 Tax=Streptobacillus felis TaxID=1384509 RepID=A0A7Z0PFI1_9FUSO|nr:chromosome segregation protein SMC [Streptobacillus felis]NYV27240.1 chromosome segregation protein SMC [Streptobacillus felis]